MVGLVKTAQVYLPVNHARRAAKVGEPQEESFTFSVIRVNGPVPDANRISPHTIRHTAIFLTEQLTSGPNRKTCQKPKAIRRQTDGIPLFLAIFRHPTYHRLGSLPGLGA